MPKDVFIAQYSVKKKIVRVMSKLYLITKKSTYDQWKDGLPFRVHYGVKIVSESTKYIYIMLDSAGDMLEKYQWIESIVEDCDTLQVEK